MPTSVVARHGAGVIDGNKTLLQSGGATVFLDFGTSYTSRESYYEEFLSSRSIRGLLDPLVMGLLPPIRGVYRADMEPPGIDLWQRVEPAQTADLDGVLLSHAHVDHTGSISSVRGDRPVFASLMTGVLCKAIQDSGRESFEQEVCYLTPKQEKECLLESGHCKTTAAHQRPFRILGEPNIPLGVRDFWTHSWASRQLIATMSDQHAGGNAVDRHFHRSQHNTCGLPRVSPHRRRSARSSRCWRREAGL